MGYEVAECGDASRILAAIERERPDLILQDSRMPGLDLERLVREIRGKHGSIPIVLFTASMDADDDCARVRANGVIEKPFRPDDLLSTLDATLKATTQTIRGSPSRVVDFLSDNLFPGPSVEPA